MISSISHRIIKNASRNILSSTMNQKLFARKAFSSKVPTDAKDKVLYVLGIHLANNMGHVKNLVDADELKIVLTGMEDALIGSVENKDELLQGTSINEFIQARMGNLVSSMKEAGEEFNTLYMSQNPNAVKTSSGLIINISEEGDGATPTVSDKVLCHYHGTHVNGDVFDSSVARGEPISFPLSGVIKGWTEGLQMMKEGGKATLIVPSDLAYGDQGQSGIPGGSTLVFEVQLIKVE